MIVVDRIEGVYAVALEDGSITNIPVNMLPSNIKEGDVVIRTAEGYIIDSEATDELRRKNSDLESGLWK